MSKKTPQQLGYEWDYELARMIGGERHAGSGNRIFARLDASGHGLVISGKYTSHASFSLGEHDLDEMARACIGPEAADPTIIPILGVKYASGRKVAVMDLAQLVDWLRAPPELIPSTKQDQIRRTARTPSLSRDE